MDMRKDKTRKSITNSFLELRSKKPIEKISIKELCEKAMISKSTFYSHYLDIYDLSEQLEDEVIQKAVSNISDFNLIFNNQKEFVRQLFIIYSSQKNLIDILFSGNRNGLFIQKMEKFLKKLIFEHYPHYENNISANIIISYGIYGGFYAFSECKEKDYEKALCILSDISEKSLKLLNEI